MLEMQTATNAVPSFAVMETSGPLGEDDNVVQVDHMATTYFVHDSSRASSPSSSLLGLDPPDVSGTSWC